MKTPAEDEILKKTAGFGGLRTLRLLCSALLFTFGLGW